MARAACCWITNISGPPRRSAMAAGGSGVISKARLAVYSSSSEDFEAGGWLARLLFATETLRNADVSRNERLFLQGVGGVFLSGEAARLRDAAPLCPAAPDGRDQQHLLQDAGRGAARSLGAGGPRGLHLHAQGTPPHHPHQAHQGCRG